MNLPFCVGSYVVRACSCANPESASMSLVTWNSLLKMGKIVLSHFHMWCLHRCGARKKGAGGEGLVSACSHTYIWNCTQSSWRRRWGRVCRAFRAQIWKAWCAACFIQRPHIRWFSNKWKNVFSTVELPFCSHSRCRVYADGKPCFQYGSLAFDPAGDLQSALIHTALSVGNIAAKLLITTAQSPKGFKWCIKQCSSICHVWFLLLGMPDCGELSLFRCEQEGRAHYFFLWGPW